jgi:hypothetical protein
MAGVTEEDHRILRERIQTRRGGVRIAVVSEVVDAQGVDQDEDQIEGARVAPGFSAASERADRGDQGARHAAKESGAARRHGRHDTTAPVEDEEPGASELLQEARDRLAARFHQRRDSCHMLKW